MMKPIQRLLGTISETTLFGFLPLDIVLHLLFGVIITYFAFKYTKSIIKAFFICLAIAVSKELYDSNTLVASWKEAIKDIVVTIIYPSILVIVHRLKSKANRE